MSKFTTYEETFCEFRRVVNNIMFNHCTGVQINDDNYEKSYKMLVKILGNCYVKTDSKTLTHVVSDEREVLAMFTLFAGTSFVEGYGFDLLIGTGRNLVELTVTVALPHNLREFLLRISKLPKGQYIVQKEEETGKLIAVQKFSLG